MDSTNVFFSSPLYFIATHLHTNCCCFSLCFSSSYVFRGLFTGGSIDTGPESPVCSVYNDTKGHASDVISGAFPDRHCFY